MKNGSISRGNQHTTDPIELRALLNGALPTAHRVSEARWRNVESLLRKSMALLDPKVIPVRSRGELMTEWTDLLAVPEAKPMQRGLARFSKHCSAISIAPAAVTQEVYDHYYKELYQHGLMRSPRETHQTAGHTWNKARETVPGWPALQLSIQDFRQNRSLPWEAFPESFQQSVEAFLAPRSEEVFNVESDSPPVLRPATIAHKRTQIRQFATALVESGYDPAGISSLADLVTVDAALAGMTVLAKRAGKTKTGRNQGIAYLLLSIAKYHVRARRGTIKKLTKICHQSKPPKTGLTSKNKLRLHQFEKPELLGALLELPAKLMAEACRVGVPTKVEARIAQLAIAIELLLMAPIRIKNVSELEIGRTLFLDGKRSGQILIDSSEVKNTLDIEVPLPVSLVAMMDTYFKRFHPLLAPPGCNMLFPSADSGHKRTPVLGTQISKCVRVRCGIKMNPHLFRHLAAKLYLDAFPGSYGVMAMLLGHKNINTTMRAYCGFEFAASFKTYDTFLANRREAIGKSGAQAHIIKGFH